MKIQILHDRAGRIYSVFAPSGGARTGTIASLDSEMMVIEVEAPEVMLPPDVDEQDRIASSLSKFIEEYEVRAGRLIERPERLAD
jgi:hypothetical protein